MKSNKIMKTILSNYFKRKATLYVFGVLAFLLISFNNSEAQISRGGTPKSFGLDLQDQIMTKTMPSIDLAKIIYI